MKIKSGAGTDMRRYACGMAVAMFLLVGAPSGWSQQQYLYTPAELGAEGASQGRDGILVQDVEVKKGDTLFKISHKFSGHGSYYSQILLFNAIRNPNRIYPGEVFKIPVSRKTVPGQLDKAPVKNEKSAGHAGDVAVPQNKQVAAVRTAAPVSKNPVRHMKKNEVSREKRRGGREKAAESAKKLASREHQHMVATTGDSASGQKLFERAAKAYRENDCRAALKLFDRFLVTNQTSPLAADASLYKADCYLKLSNQN